MTTRSCKKNLDFECILGFVLFMLYYNKNTKLYIYQSPFITALIQLID